MDTNFEQQTQSLVQVPHCALACQFRLDFLAIVNFDENVVQVLLYTNSSISLTSE